MSDISNQPEWSMPAAMAIPKGVSAAEIKEALPFKASFSDTLVQMR
jgi:hypothetical protein